LSPVQVVWVMAARTIVMVPPESVGVVAARPERGVVRVARYCLPGAW
jgi:hypothetical protein